MNKREAIIFCLYKHRPDIEDYFNKYGLDLEQFIDIISKPNYSLYKELPMPDKRIANLLTDLFPTKPKTTVKLCNWLLEIYDYKFCAKCNNIHSLAHFHKDSSTRSGLNNYCIDCGKPSKEHSRANTAKYRASKLNATPKWANLTVIRRIYADCPVGCQVDHVIPLQGINVCGLHVENNLSYLPARINTSKGNKMPEEYFFANRLKRPTQFEGIKITS